MFGNVRPIYFRLGQVMSGKFRLGKLSLGIGMFGQVRKS